VPITAWDKPAGVSLLGDAIHVMSPAVGVGANTALRDATVLAEHLADTAAGQPVTAALRAYQTEMLGYAFDAVRESARRGRDLVGQDPLPTAVG
jgi:2-polyprenyl-6-methoxyphenol hydroxylase-like FAD-dependent oxidoreductase